jgi:hypothetical protein
MLCDWRRARCAYGGDGDTPKWYAGNKGKMILGSSTRHFVECELGYEKA